MRVLAALIALWPAVVGAQTLAIYDAGELDEPVSGYASELSESLQLTTADLQSRVLLTAPDNEAQNVWMRSYEAAVQDSADMGALSAWWLQAQRDRWLLAMNPTVAARVFELAQRLAELAEEAGDRDTLFETHQALAELAPHATPEGLSDAFEHAWDTMRTELANTREVPVSWGGADTCEIRINGVGLPIENGDQVLLGPGENFAQLACENWTSHVYRLRDTDNELVFDEVLDDMLVLVDGVPTLRTRGGTSAADLRSVAHALAWVSGAESIILMGLREASGLIPASLELTGCSGDTGLTCRTMRLPLEEESLSNWTERAEDYLTTGTTTGPVAVWDAGREEWIRIGFGEAFEEASWVDAQSRRMQRIAIGAGGLAFVSAVAAVYFGRQETATAQEIQECDDVCVMVEHRMSLLRNERQNEAAATVVSGSASLVFAAVAATMAIRGQRRTGSHRFTTTVGMTPYGGVAAAATWRF